MLIEAVEKLLNDAEACVQQVHADQLATTDLENFLVLDVREDSEFSTGYLPNAISLPRSRMELACTSLDGLTNNQKPVLVYCKSGRRSLLAAQTLQQLGVPSPISMAGGVTAWLAAKKPLIRP